MREKKKSHDGRYQLMGCISFFSIRNGRGFLIIFPQQAHQNISTQKHSKYGINVFKPKSSSTLFAIMKSFGDMVFSFPFFLLLFFFWRNCFSLRCKPHHRPSDIFYCIFKSKNVNCATKAPLIKCNSPPESQRWSLCLGNIAGDAVASEMCVWAGRGRGGRTVEIKCYPKSS